MPQRTSRRTWSASGSMVSTSTRTPSLPATVRSIADRFERFVDGGIIGGPPTEAGETRLYLAGREAETVAALWAGSTLTARVLDGADRICVRPSRPHTRAGPRAALPCCSPSGRTPKPTPSGTISLPNGSCRFPARRPGRPNGRPYRAKGVAVRRRDGGDRSSHGRRWFACRVPRCRTRDLPPALRPQRIGQHHRRGREPQTPRVVGHLDRSGLPTGPTIEAAGPRRRLRRSALPHPWWPSRAAPNPD